MKTNYTSVDEYIVSFPEKLNTLLHKVRTTILKKNPQSVESISYGMPTYKTNGKPLIYFAGYKKHIGVYSIPIECKELNKELSKYKQGKGSVQFQIDKPIPYNLIGRIVEYKVKEIRTKNNIA